MNKRQAKKRRNKNFINFLNNCFDNLGIQKIVYDTEKEKFIFYK